MCRINILCFSNLANIPVLGVLKKGFQPTNYLYFMVFGFPTSISYLHLPLAEEVKSALDDREAALDVQV